jgi:hypothetical protein
MYDDSLSLFKYDDSSSYFKCNVILS